MRRRFSLIDNWRNFLDSLDTGGGHIFCALLILVLGTWAYIHIDSTAGGQVMTGALTALWVMLKNVKSNREQMSATATQVTQTTSTEPPPTTPPPIVTPQLPEEHDA